MRRLRLLVPITGALLVLLVASPVFACGGLIAPNGAVQLVRTTTLAAYHEGIEHYVTSFEFAGDGEFGSIVPLPGVPTKVIRGGDWTLQRLALETQPQPEGELLFAVDAAGAAEARVILETKIDALDVVVLEGGAISVGNWAREHGFLLPPDAPEVLEFYAKRSPIFMAVRYDGARAADQGLAAGAHADARRAPAQLLAEDAEHRGVPGRSPVLLGVLDPVEAQLAHPAKQLGGNLAGGVDPVGDGEDLLLDERGHHPAELLVFVGEGDRHRI